MNKEILSQAQSAERISTYQPLYPDVFYKLQPFIITACDQLDTYWAMPTQDVIERVSDEICTQSCAIYPDVAEYAKEYEWAAKSYPEEIQTINHAPGGGYYGGHRRRRGLFRDMVGILLISELLRRRRRYY